MHDLRCAMLPPLLGAALAHHTDLTLKFPGYPAWLPAMASLTTTARGGSTPLADTTNGDTFRARVPPRVITWRSGVPPFTGSVYNPTRTASGQARPHRPGF